MTRPRHCSSRWLDEDCPKDVLAIIDHGEGQLERYDVIYAELYGADCRGGGWLAGFCMSESGNGYHFELLAHQVAAYRYRSAHRYAKWSTLPDAVKTAVRRDLEVIV